MTAGVLVVSWSRTGGTTALTEAVVAGATAAVAAMDGTVTVTVRSPFETDADHILACAGIVLATPENFGYMSGAMKHFFDETFYELGDETRGLPYALVVRAGSDGTGAVRSIEPLAVGLGWRQIAPPLVAVGDQIDEHLEAAAEIGATMAAGIESNLW